MCRTRHRRRKAGRCRRCDSWAGWSSQDIRVWKWARGSGQRTECCRSMALEVAETGTEAAEAVVLVAMEGMAAAMGAMGTTVETAVETVETAAQEEVVSTA